MKELNLPNVSPVAVTTDLQEFVGNNLDKVTDKLEEIAEGIDGVKVSTIANYNQQSTLLNTLGSKISVLESTVSNTIYSQADEAEDFVWVSDTFATENFNNGDKTTALVNTDRGVLTLRPDKYENITNFTYSLDKSVMIGSKTLPGCNMLAIQVSPGSTNTEPQATFEESNITSLASLFDNNAATHFEVERNFIYQKQKLKNFGKAFVFDVTGGEKDVITITNNFDWTVNIGWPNENSIDEGPGNKGYAITEFIDTTGGSLNTNKEAEFAINIDLTTPQTLSGIRVLPYIRHKKGLMKIKLASVYLEGLADPIVIAKDFGLNNNETTATKFNLFSLTSPEVSGKFVPINSSRKVTKIVLHFSGSESEDILLGHPFVWINLHRRSERNYGLFKSVDHEDIPKRLELFSAGRPKIEFKSSSPSPFGNINTSGSTPGTVLESENRGGPLGFLSDAATSAAGQVQSKNIYTNFLIDLAAGTGIISNLLNIGGFNRSFTVTDQKSGVDLFNGFRSSIALKSILLERVSYKESGSYFSNKMVFPKPVTRISLATELNIPQEWGSSTWVQFYYSLDDGVSWSIIKPSAGSDFDNSIVLPRPITNIRVKIDLSRPLTDKERTAEVLYYAIKGFTG